MLSLSERERPVTRVESRGSRLYGPLALCIVGVSQVVLLSQTTSAKDWLQLCLFVVFAFGTVALVWVRASKANEAARRYAADLQSANEGLKQEIQERNRMEDALRQLSDKLVKSDHDAQESLRLIEALLNTIPSPVFYKDANLKYCLCNTAFAQQIVGAAKDQVIGRTIQDYPAVFSESLVALVLRKDQELLEQGASQRFESRILCQDGVERDFLMSRTIFKPDAQTSPGIIGVMADITESKRAEEALEISRGRLTEAMAMAHLASWECDTISRTFSFNDEFYGLHGTTAKLEGGYEMGLEAYFTAFLLPGEISSVIKELDQRVAAANADEVIEIEHRIRRRDGEIRHMLVRLAVTKDATGQVIKTHGSNQDITERKRTEVELQKLWRAVEFSPAAVFTTDLRGCIEYVNPKFIEITGYTAEEALGKNPRILNSGFHSAQFYKELWTTLLGGNVWRSELCNRKKNGELYWESASISPIRNEKNEITHFVAIKEDITERKEGAEELKRTAAALRQREAFLRTVTEAAPQSFYVADNRTDEILYFNRRFCEIWGLEALKGRMERGELKHSELTPYLVDKIGDVSTFTGRYASFQCIENRVVVDVEVGLLDGRTLRHYSTQIRGENDQYFGRLCLIEDISQRKKADQQLAASLKEKEILLREVYHRVKNNLQVISSLLNLQAGAIVDPKTLELLRETRNRVRSMALVHEKLYQANDLSLIDFAEYAKQLVAMLSRSYRTDANVIDVHFAMENIRLNLDTSIPCGLILNELVSNALKYAFSWPREGTPAELHVELRTAHQGYYILTVSDNGVGLPDHIDIHETKTLGLQVICMLAEQLGGTVEAERGAGTKFIVTFRELRERMKKGTDAC